MRIVLLLLLVAIVAGIAGVVLLIFLIRSRKPEPRGFPIEPIMEDKGKNP